MSTSSNKHKATAKEHATQRLHNRENAGDQPQASVPTSTKEMSQGRHPGESPMTGEDRPSHKTDGKKAGQQTANTVRQDRMR